MPRRRDIPRRAVIVESVTEYITAETLIKRWGGAVTDGTLRNWRSERRGPPWARFEKRVVYPLAELIEWEKLNRP